MRSAVLAARGSASSRCARRCASTCGRRDVGRDGLQRLERAAGPSGRRVPRTRARRSAAAPRRVEHALAARLGDEAGDLVAGEGAGDLVARLDAEGAQRAVGDPVQQRDRRGAATRTIMRQRRREQRARRGRARRARCSWGPSRRARRAGSRSRPSAIAKATGCTSASGTPIVSNGPSSDVRDRGLAEVAEAERADRDAQLRAGHHQRDVLHRPQRGPRARGRPPRRAARSRLRRAEISANSAPTKKALATSSRALIASAVPVLTSAPRRLGCVPARTRSTRRSSMRDARSASTSCGAPSVVVGAASVDRVAHGGDAAEPVADQAADGLVVVVLGQPDADGAAHLVRAHQAGERSSAPSGSRRARLLAARRARRGPRRRSPRPGPRA